MAATRSRTHGGASRRASTSPGSRWCLKSAPVAPVALELAGAAFAVLLAPLLLPPPPLLLLAELAALLTALPGLRAPCLLAGRRWS
jgi:hypothetical protein